MRRYLYIFLLFFCQSVFAATNISSIGTTGRDYSTMQAWETAVEGDLITAGDIEKGECYDDSDFNETVIINGSTTDSSNYMWLTAASGEEHSGTDANGVVNDRTTTDALLFRLRDPNTVFENIIALNGGGTRAHVLVGAASCIIRNIISRNCTNSDFDCDNDGDGSFFINCISIDATVEGFRFRGTSAGYWYNCLAWGAGSDGFFGSNVVTDAANNMAFGSVDGDFTSVNNQSYNISEDATATGTGSLASRTATANASPGAGDFVIFTNISSGTEDFHLQDNTTDNDAQDAGTDVSGTTSYSLDIDLETRSGTWDIGPDEFISVGVTFIPKILWY